MLYTYTYQKHFPNWGIIQFNILLFIYLSCVSHNCTLTVAALKNITMDDNNIFFRFIVVLRKKENKSIAVVIDF